PAYTQDGILFSRVYLGTTDTDMFEDFIEQLLPHCGRFPEPKSILVLDNVSYHRSEPSSQMCDVAGVEVLLFASVFAPVFAPLESHRRVLCRTKGFHQEE